MAGYCGISMSNNAIDAYKDGEMPISKWKKRTIIDKIQEKVANGELSLQCDMKNLSKIPLAVLKKNFLQNSSWHHTGLYFNETQLYSLDIDKLEKLTDENIQKMISAHKQEKK